MQPDPSDCQRRWWLPLLGLILVAGCSLDTTGQPNSADSRVDRDSGFDVGDVGDLSTDGARQDPGDGSTGWDFGTSEDTGPAELTLTGVVPSSGPVSGGNEVRIDGTGLSETSLFFGGIRADVRRSGQGWTATVPQASGPGSATVKAVRPSGDSVSLSDAYTYVDGLTVESVTPRRVPVEGGVQVTVRGTGFEPPLGVSIGGRAAVRTDRVSSTRLRVVVPPGEPGEAALRVTTSQDSASLVDGIVYVPPVEVESIDPAAGPTTGDTAVTLEATGIDDSTTVQFGGRPATIVEREGSTITVRTPAHQAGLVDVVVTGPGAAAVVENGYLYTSDPGNDVAAIRPQTGPSDGGTEVTVVGQGLDTPDIEVEFGSSQAQVLERHETWLLVQTSAHPPGTVDVVVRGSERGAQRLTDAFTFVDPVEVDSLDPAVGPSRGGSTVVVKGRGFEGLERVEFGGLPAQFSVDSDRRITATTPAHGPGTVDVHLKRGSVEKTIADGFRYREPLEVWGFSPVRGAVAGGTRVVIRGRGFEASNEVSFGDEPATISSTPGPYRMVVTAPSGSVGTVDIDVRRGDQSAAGPYLYEYFNPASRYGGVDGGPVNGAVNVSVFSDSGGPIEDAFVMLSTRSDTPYSGVTNGSGQITLSGPGVMGPQTVTATAAGFSSATVREVDAQNITLFLSPLEDPPPSGGGGGEGGTPSGRITGEVLGPRKVDQPGATTEFDIAKVAVTRRQRRYGTVEPGPGSVTFGEGRFEIDSRIGDVAAVALCGDYDASTDTFTPRFMGVHRYINVAEGAQVEADIRCAHRLDESLAVKVSRPIYAPGGPNQNRAEVFFDFGFEGVFPAPTPATGLGTVLEVPRLPEFEGALADVSLTVVAGSYTAGGDPFSEMVRTDVVDTGAAVEMPALLDVPEPVEPQPGSIWNGRSIRFQATGPPFPDFWRVILYNREGREFWEYLMDGRETTVRLPSFPSFDDLPAETRPAPFPSGRVYMILMGVDAKAAGLNNFTYRDLYASSWHGYSMVRWNFERRPDR